MVSVISLAELVAQEEKLLLGVHHVGQGLGVLHGGGHVHYAADVGPAVADKHPHPGLLALHVHLLRVDPLGGELVPAVVQQLAALGARAAGREHRFGNVHGTLEGAAHEDAAPAGLHGIFRARGAEAVVVQLHPNLAARSWLSAGGFSPTDRTTMSNSSSLTPSSLVA